MNTPSRLSIVLLAHLMMSVSCTDLRGASTPPADGDGGAPADGALAADSAVPGGGGPGPVETVAEKLVGGLGVAVSTTHVYWAEEGVSAGSNYDGVFRRLPIDQVCKPGQNCGAALPSNLGVYTYFGDTFTGPLASPSGACVAVIYNASRDTEFQCLRQSDGRTVTQPSVVYAGSMRQLVGDDLYFSVPAHAPSVQSSVRKWSMASPTQAPSEVLTRTASSIGDFVLAGNSYVWLEHVGTKTSLWTQPIGGVAEQLAAPRPGSGFIEVDADHVYVSRLDEGVVVAYPRSGLTAGVTILTNRLTPAHLARRGPYLLLISYGSAPDYTNGRLERCLADGTSCITLSADPSLTAFTANDTTVWYSTFGVTPNFEGTVQRRTF